MAELEELRTDLWRGLVKTTLVDNISTEKSE